MHRDPTAGARHTQLINLMSNTYLPPTKYIHTCYHVQDAEHAAHLTAVGIPRLLIFVPLQGIDIKVTASGWTYCEYHSSARRE